MSFVYANAEMGVAIEVTNGSRARRRALKASRICAHPTSGKIGIAVRGDLRSRRTHGQERS